MSSTSSGEQPSDVRLHRVEVQMALPLWAPREGLRQIVSGILSAHAQRNNHVRLCLADAKRTRATPAPATTDRVQNCSPDSLVQIEYMATENDAAALRQELLAIEIRGRKAFKVVLEAESAATPDPVVAPHLGIADA